MGPNPQPQGPGPRHPPSACRVPLLMREETRKGAEGPSTVMGEGRRESACSARRCTPAAREWGVWLGPPGSWPHIGTHKSASCVLASPQMAPFLTLQSLQENPVSLVHSHAQSLITACC